MYTIVYKGDNMAYMFRVQNSKGKGPYNSQDRWALNPHILKTNRPAAYRDLYPPVSVDGRYFGFNDLKQLTDWFWNETELNNLANRGYKVCLVRVHSKENTGRQIIGHILYTEKEITWDKVRKIHNRLKPTTYHNVD